MAIPSFSFFFHIFSSFHIELFYIKITRYKSPCKFFLHDIKGKAISHANIISQQLIYWSVKYFPFKTKF